jgi:hypothetical protein
MIQREDALIGEGGSDVIRPMRVEGPSGLGTGSSGGAAPKGATAKEGGAHSKGGFPAAPLSIPGGSSIGIGLANIGRSPHLQGLPSLGHLKDKSTQDYK